TAGSKRWDDAITTHEMPTRLKRRHPFTSSKFLKIKLRTLAGEVWAAFLHPTPHTQSYGNKNNRRPIKGSGGG
ncbi:hypothetical protein ABTC82_20065, partial [Acinetobacter baumannii]